MVTILQNKYGELLVWKGERYIFAKGRDKHIDYKGNECDLRFTYEEDIHNIIKIFNRQERYKLDSGDYIHTENFDDQLFNDI